VKEKKNEKVLWHGHAQVAEGAERQRTRAEKLESREREKKKSDRRDSKIDCLPLGATQS